MVDKDFTYDAIVVGVGHAGIEAGLALARMGKRTLMLGISLDSVGYLACNPSIGGTAKGHLVREIDALGGQMGITTDNTMTQIRMLNTSKGAAVQSLRAQVDKYKYHAEMKRVLENEPNIHLRQGEVTQILTENDRVIGVRTTYLEYRANCVIIACGVYLESNIIVGNVKEPRGPASFARSNHLANSLRGLGIELRTFKTGTPARVKRDSVDLTVLQLQPSERTLYTFSDMTSHKSKLKTVCYLGYTNETTHDVIRNNLDRTPRSLGLMSGVGARYCPSIEDKIIRFADKERHQFFLEPEGDNTQEMYVQGISTSLPADVQLQMYRTIRGFENVEIMRDAYAIEYECINPMQLYPTLEHKGIHGLYFAGQINGTSGYEEAASQGIVAGINAALALSGKQPMILHRENSYIGVLIDDLVTKGTDEPYRMMTSRAENRLVIRQDNADLRLTEIGYKVGLVTEERYKKLTNKLRDIERASRILPKVLPKSVLQQLFDPIGEPYPDNGLTFEEFIRRTSVTFEMVLGLKGIRWISNMAMYEVYTRVRYAGYIARNDRVREEQLKAENMPLDTDIDYTTIKGLRLEAAEKLNIVKPLSIGQAGRINGVNPADINVLIIHFAHSKAKKRDE